jgi:outer membrane lipoprotein SlyB
MIKVLTIAFCLIIASGCTSLRDKGSEQPITGSVVSGSFFADSSQFRNNQVKLRLRDTSGDEFFSISRLKKNVVTGLELAGYNVTSNDDFGILIDVNVRKISRGVDASSNSGVGVLLGGVVGAEASSGNNSGISSVSGMIVGAVAGNSIETVIRKAGSKQTFILRADVNIGISESDSNSEAEIIIGQSKFKKSPTMSTYNAFSMTDSLEVVVYGGGNKADVVITAIENRLGRILSSIL